MTKEHQHVTIWEARVSDLILEFSRAMRTLVPHLDAARIEWRLPGRYDDFDRIAEALYVSFVLSPAMHDERFSDLGLGDFRPFGFSGDDWLAHVAAVAPNGREALPFVDLDSDRQPFDTAVLDPPHQKDRIAVPVVNTEFLVVRDEGSPIAVLHVDQ